MHFVRHIARFGKQPTGTGDADADKFSRSARLYAHELRREIGMSGGGDAIERNARGAEDAQGMGKALGGVNQKVVAELDAGLIELTGLRGRAGRENRDFRIVYKNIAGLHGARGSGGKLAISLA